MSIDVSPRLGAALVLALTAGCGRCALADDDDQKLRDRKPAIVGPVVRHPDPWKLADRVAPGALPGAADDTFISRNMVMRAWLPLSNFPGYAGAAEKSAADCWGYTSASGREYALIGLGWGTGVVEVTDPANPAIVTVVPGPNSLWHDVTVIGTYAYAVTDQTGVGVQVLNLSQIDSGSVTLVRNYSQGGHTTTHTIVSNPDSGYLYLCGGNAANGGMIPAATAPDPTFPTFSGTGWRTQYVHEAQIVSYTSGPYAGKEIAFCFAGGPYYGNSNGLAIVDITNKLSPATLSLISYPGIRFCHQGWTTADRKHLYINDELDAPSAGSGNTPRFLGRIFDVSNLSEPRVVSVFQNGLPSVDHNEYVKGRYLYMSNYTTGLRVWDLEAPLKPREVAYFDTRPEDDGTSYNGAWGNYPYFPSGTVIVSDLERGLFVLQLSVLEFEQAGVLPATLQPGVRTPVSIRVKEQGAQVAKVEVHANVNGLPAQPYPMSLQPDGSYAGELPAALCHDRMSYFFLATATNGRTFVWPYLAVNGEPLRADVQTSQTTLFSDTFQSSLGWTVQNDASLTAGGWARGVPVAWTSGAPLHGSPKSDADGSGSCYVTGNTAGADVDGGPTRLLSPALDLSGAPEARVTYQRWLVSLVGSPDVLTTEISNNNGSSWTTVHDAYQATGGWEQVRFRVADYVTPTSQVRVRFSIADAGNDSTTEAAVDGFTVTSLGCESCMANCDGSTSAPVLNVADFTCFLQRYALGEPYANCDGSTTLPAVNVADFTCFLQQYAGGCP
jgi:choice-of-anchor B domain-containing protein